MNPSTTLLRTLFLLAWTSIFVLPNGISQNYVDLVKIDYSLSPNNEFTDSDQTTDVKDLAVDLNLPIVLSEKTALVTGFLFEHIQARLDPDQEDVSTFFTLNLKLGLSKTYSDQWSASYIILPKIASDLKELGGDDFQVGALTLFKFKKRPNFHYKFGAYYNSELSGPFFVPFLGLYYQKGKFETNLLLPVMGDAGYKLGGPFKVGIRFNGLIKSFNLNADQNGMGGYMSRANNEVGGYLGLTFGSINIIGFAGTSIGRTYRTYEQNDKVAASLTALRFGDDRNQLNTDFSNGLVLKASLIYRFSLEDK